MPARSETRGGLKKSGAPPVRYTGRSGERTLAQPTARRLRRRRATGQDAIGCVSYAWSVLMPPATAWPYLLWSSWGAIAFTALLALIRIAWILLTRDPDKDKPDRTRQA